MMSQNLSKNLTNISIFCNTLTDKIFDDMRFIQLMNLLITRNNLYDYSYCFYCDNSDLKTNLFFPIFHTSYLASNTNNVLIRDKNDIWLTKIFPHNKFYILRDHIDEFDFSDCGVKIIDHINDLRSNNEQV